MSKLTMPAFLKSVAAEVSSLLPLFRDRHDAKGGKHIAIGRSFESKVFVFVDFSGGSHRRTVGHGVGWAPSFDHYVAWQERRENDPIQLYDGSLRRLQQLEMPRDFSYTEVHRATSTLYAPMQILDMDQQSPDELRALILKDIDSYALPYLALMLTKRHGVGLGALQLAGRQTPQCLGESV